jgi:hypothetical protein
LSSRKETALITNVCNSAAFPDFDKQLINNKHLYQPATILQKSSSLGPSTCYPLRNNFVLIVNVGYFSSKLSCSVRAAGGCNVFDIAFSKL